MGLSPALDLGWIKQNIPINTTGSSYLINKQYNGNYFSLRQTFLFKDSLLTFLKLSSLINMSIHNWRFANIKNLKSKEKS